MTENLPYTAPVRYNHTTLLSGGLATAPGLRARAARLRQIAADFIGDTGVYKAALEMAAEHEALAEILEAERSGRDAV